MLVKNFLQYSLDLSVSSFSGNLQTILFQAVKDWNLMDNIPKYWVFIFGNIILLTEAPLVLWSCTFLIRVKLFNRADGRLPFMQSWTYKKLSNWILSLNFNLKNWWP